MSEAGAGARKVWGRFGRRSKRRVRVRVRVRAVTLPIVPVGRPP